MNCFPKFKTEGSDFCFSSGKEASILLLHNKLHLRYIFLGIILMPSDLVIIQSLINAYKMNKYNLEQSVNENVFLNIYNTIFITVLLSFHISLGFVFVFLTLDFLT